MYYHHPALFYTPTRSLSSLNIFFSEMKIYTDTHSAVILLFRRARFGHKYLIRSPLFFKHTRRILIHFPEGYDFQSAGINLQGGNKSVFCFWTFGLICFYLNLRDISRGFSCRRCSGRGLCSGGRRVSAKNVGDLVENGYDEISQLGRALRGWWIAFSLLQSASFSAHIAKVPKKPENRIISINDLLKIIWKFATMIYFKGKTKICLKLL